MSKNVLVLSASPRRGGNSDLLCDQFCVGAKESNHVVEKIFVKHQKINYCLGCCACQSNEGRCIQDDDMHEIIEQLLIADVIVMASPVYFFTIDGQMKTLIDRVLPKFTQIKNKEFYYIITAAVTDVDLLQRTVECFRGFTDCLEGSIEKGIIYGNGVLERNEILNHPAMIDAYELGKNL